MKCLLHIGTEKTATTTLQDWLYGNEVELNKAGFYLSKILGKTNNRLFPAYFQSQLDEWAKANGIGSKAEKEKYFYGFLEKLSDEIYVASKSYETFIITSEHLHSRVIKQEEIKRLHSFLTNLFDEVEVVCYFRDQYDVAVSLYSTVLRGESDVDFDSFVDRADPQNYYYNYLQVADNWSGVFGRDKCNFRIFDKSKFVGNDIRLDFLSVVGVDVDPTNLNMGIEESNKSLSMLQSSAFKVINRNIKYWSPEKNGTNKNNTNAKKRILSTASLKLGKITGSNSDLIRSRFTETNAIFFRKYFTAEESFPVSLSGRDHEITSVQASIAVEDALELGLSINKAITPTIAEDHINSLRDIALRLYDRNPDSIEDALTIMKIALQYRPHGNLIKDKVQEWSSILGSRPNQAPSKKTSD